MKRNSNFFTVLNGNPSISWDLIRGDVGQQLFGRKYSTVPMLHEAKTFDILCVYKKVSNGESTTTCSQCAGIDNSTYQIIGFLRDLLLVSKCNEQKLLDIAADDVDTKIAPVYQFSHQETCEGLLKEVILRVFSVYHQKSLVDHISAKEIFLDTSLAPLNGLKKVYILCDVFFCKRFYLYTRIGRREIIDNQADERFPLGFRSAKFKLDQAGSLHFKKHCKAHKKWIASGVTNTQVKNMPLLPDKVPVKRRDDDKIIGKSGRRNPHSLFGRLSLKKMSKINFYIDDPDYDVMHDHEMSETSGVTNINKKVKVDKVEVKDKKGVENYPDIRNVKPD